METDLEFITGLIKLFDAAKDHDPMNWHQTDADHAHYELKRKLADRATLGRLLELARKGEELASEQREA